MTVCIAAICEGEKQLVLASDSRVGFGDFSSDKGVVKHRRLLDSCIVLIAGNDVGYAGETLKRIERRLRTIRMPDMQYAVDAKDLDEVALVAHEELVETRKRMVEAKILKRYGITSSDFTKKGKRLFTDQVFYEICSKIANLELSLHFLLAGFDHSGRGHLRVVDAGDVPIDYDSLGFAAIGSGAAAAMAALSFAKDHSNLCTAGTLWSTACHVLSAKFMSESATDVGHATFLLSIGSEGEFQPHSFCGIGAVRKAWEKTGAPRLSREAVDVLKDVLFKGGLADMFKGEVVDRCLKHCSPGFRRTLKDYAKVTREQGNPSDEQIAKWLESKPFSNVL